MLSYFCVDANIRKGGIIRVFFKFLCLKPTKVGGVALLIIWEEDDDPKNGIESCL